MQSHSVTLDKDKCKGCTDCIKRCPTEAIRVRGSKAMIIENRCIDCGNCIRICHSGAKKAVTDDLSLMECFKYRIAMPAPALYGQFPKAKDVSCILNSLCEIGFTDVFEVAVAGEIIAQHTYAYLKKATRFPVISSACPVIVRLIQRRFPSLIHQVLPIISPMELGGRYIKSYFKKQGISDVGVFFISPCPAKATEIYRPKGIKSSAIDGVFSIQELYKQILSHLNKETKTSIKQQSSASGLRWALPNGGIDEKIIKHQIAVDGMDNVIAILEKVEDGTLDDVTYIEALACTGGCLGGVLNVENAFMSRNTLKGFIEKDCKHKQISNLQDLEKVPYLFEQALQPRPVFTLDQDVSRALEKMASIEAFYKKLPQIDCGLCGAPTCRCFAEDVIMGKAHGEACIFILREKIKNLSDQMYQLTQIVMPTEGEKLKGESK